MFRPHFSLIVIVLDWGYRILFEVTESRRSSLIEHQDIVVRLLYFLSDHDISLINCKSLEGSWSNIFIFFNFF